MRARSATYTVTVRDERHRRKSRIALRPMSKVSSSSIVVQFTQQFPTWEVFNRWREDWLGGVLAKGGAVLSRMRNLYAICLERAVIPKPS